MRYGFQFSIEDRIHTVYDKMKENEKHKIKETVKTIAFRCIYACLFQMHTFEWFNQPLLRMLRMLNKVLWQSVSLYLKLSHRL